MRGRSSSRRAATARTIGDMGGIGNSDSFEISRLGAIAAGLARAVSLAVLAWLLFMVDDRMPMTVLISGLIAIGAAVYLSEHAIDRSPHDIKKTL
jgi:hypothetical protein